MKTGNIDCLVANTPPHRVGGEQVGSQLRKRWPPLSWRSGGFHGFHEGRWLRGVTRHGLYGSKVLNWITIPKPDPSCVGMLAVGTTILKPPFDGFMDHPHFPH